MALNIFEDLLNTLKRSQEFCKVQKTIKSTAKFWRVLMNFKEFLGFPILLSFECDTQDFQVFES